MSSAVVPTGMSLSSLMAETPEEGLQLAIMLARRAGEAIVPDAEMRAAMRGAYSQDTAQVIAASGVVAAFFQTVAAANDYWDASGARRTPRFARKESAGE